MKTCRHCRERKRAAEFRRNRETRDGLSSWCASCHAEATRRWRESNPEHVEAYNAQRKAEHAAARAVQREQSRVEQEERNKALRGMHRERQRRTEKLRLRRERLRKAAALRRT